MLGDATLPYIGHAKNLMLRARTCDNEYCIVHVNIPWLLGGEDRFDLPAKSGKWGWEAISLWCKGQNLLIRLDPVQKPENVLNMADPASNDRLLELVVNGIEKARQRQIEYAKRVK